jgi:hypothetical protein
MEIVSSWMADDGKADFDACSKQLRTGHKYGSLLPIMSWERKRRWRWLIHALFKLSNFRASASLALDTASTQRPIIVKKTFLDGRLAIEELEAIGGNMVEDLLVLGGVSRHLVCRKMTGYSNCILPNIKLQKTEAKWDILAVLASKRLRYASRVFNCG